MQIIRKVNSDFHTLDRAMKRAVYTFTGAIDFEFDPDEDFEILKVKVHSSGTNADTFKMTMIDKIGSAYDTVHVLVDEPWYDLVLEGTSEYYQRGDKVKFEAPNVAGNTIGIEIIYQKI